ncbi:MAG: hypothetical protein ACO36E_09700, partial [Synechocystis sp.]
MKWLKQGMSLIVCGCIWFVGQGMTMLSDPFLQNPTADAVTVVWFTETAGTAHWLELGQPVEQKINATSQRLELREDEFSYTLQTYAQLTPRPIWRHEVNVTGLTVNQVLP